MKPIPFQIPCKHLLSFVAAWISVAAAHAGPYPGEVLSDNPVAYWRFEELPGATVLEEQTGNFPGAYTFDLDEDGLPLWPQLGQPGIDTNAATFHYYENGMVPHPSYASVPNAAGFNPQGPFTVEFWARPTTDPTNYIVAVGNFAGWGAGAGGWHFYQSPAPNSRWVLFMLGGGIFIQSPPVTKFRWYHLAIVFNGTTVTFYVNGSAVGSGNAASYQANSAAPLDIGAGRNTGYGYFDGSLDELAIYTNALSLARIQAHYQTGTNSFRAGANPPSITRQPVSITNYAGRTVQFTVAADGTAPLSYQWYKGAEIIPGATSDALTFVCGVADDGASYSVVITNLYGTIQSGAVTLTVLTDLIIASNPTSITRYVGSMAAFRVVVTGALPITYQWYRGAIFDPIDGATNETLWLSNVQPGDDASMYYATVTNPFASADSASATLTVVARPTPVPITGHARAVMADGPVAYWRLNETAGASTAVDAAGSFDGTYSIGQGGAFTFGEATGVPRETDPGVGIAGGARIEIPYALELNPWGPFTVEAWVKPASLAAHGNDYRTALSSMYNPGGVGPTGWNIYQQGNNTWAWVLWGGGWANAFIVVPEPIVANNWYHLAIVYDGSLFRMYINGVARASAPYPGFARNHGGPANLGWRSDNDFGAFVGTIDDVAFYNKALGAQQILTHALSTSRITADWPNNRLRWPFGTLQEANNLDGPYGDVQGATSPWPITRSGLQRFFRIHVE